MTLHRDYIPGFSLEPKNESDHCPICPVCKRETDEFYLDLYGAIVGCDECIRRRNAWEEIING